MRRGGRTCRACAGGVTQIDWGGAQCRCLKLPTYNRAHVRFCGQARPTQARWLGCKVRGHVVYLCPKRVLWQTRLPLHAAACKHPPSQLMQFCTPGSAANADQGRGNKIAGERMKQKSAAGAGAFDRERRRVKGRPVTLASVAASAFCGVRSPCNEAFAAAQIESRQNGRRQAYVDELMAMGTARVAKKAA